MDLELKVSTTFCLYKVSYSWYSSYWADASSSSIVTCLVVNFNINAIDPSTGTQFILEHKQDIEGVIQNAYNRRGKAGIY